MATGRDGLIQRFFSLALSQKINYAFAFFFAINAVQDFLDHGGFDNIFRLTAVGMVIVFLVLARYDNVFIRYFQVTVLLLLSFLLIAVNDNPSELSGFILLSISLAAAYKMTLFGRRTQRILAIIVLFTLAFTFWAGARHGFSTIRLVNIMNFVFVYLALLYFIFEEETLTLRHQRDILTRRAEEMEPFAELGTNVTGLVHDFKNDIARLSALASVERASDNEETADKLDRYADRLLERVESILYVATGADHAQVEAISMREMLDHVVYYFVEVNRNLKHAVNISLHAEEDVTIYARRNALLVIMENVIKNSIEATEGSADRTIEISLRPTQDGAEITIEHYGRLLPWKEPPGSAVDVRKSQFFRRGKSRRPGGTGLGMINVIRALEILGARMTMENKTTGVRSVIYLPYDASGGGEASEESADSTSAS
ncbi:MAG: HAMP domain-containing sensor histidine kinase [Alkalispirochaeta sp.]